MFLVQKSTHAIKNVPIIQLGPLRKLSLFQTSPTKELVESLNTKIQNAIYKTLNIKTQKNKDPRGKIEKLLGSLREKVTRRGEKQNFRFTMKSTRRDSMTTTNKSNRFFFTKIININTNTNKKNVLFYY